VADPNPITTTTFSTTAGSANATASTATGLAVGQILSGNVNVPAGTFIKSFVGTAVVLSQNATATAATVATTLSSTFLNPNFQWKTGYLEYDLTAQVTILARQIA